MYMLLIFAKFSNYLLMDSAFKICRSRRELQNKTAVLLKNAAVEVIHVDRFQDGVSILHVTKLGF